MRSFPFELPSSHTDDGKACNSVRLGTGLWLSIIIIMVNHHHQDHHQHQHIILFLCLSALFSFPCLLLIVLIVPSRSATLLARSTPPASGETMEKRPMGSCLLFKYFTNSPSAYKLSTLRRRRRKRIEGEMRGRRKRRKKKRRGAEEEIDGQWRDTTQSKAKQGEVARCRD